MNISLASFPKILAMLIALFEPLEGVRLLGQEELEFGPAIALVTVYEKDGQPCVLVQIKNPSEGDVWWNPRGGRSRSGWWHQLFEEDRFRDEDDFSEPHLSGTTGARGCSPTRKERVPTTKELQGWCVWPGRKVFKFTQAPPPSRKDDFLYLDHSLYQWSTSFDLPLPVSRMPDRYYGVWVNARIKVDVVSPNGPVKVLVKYRKSSLR